MTLILGQRILCSLMSLGPSLHQLPVTGFRKAFDLLNNIGGVPRDKSVVVTDIAVPVADRQVGLRLYRPAGSVPTRSMVFFHGGGCVIGGLESHDGFCRQMAQQANMAIIAVDYRLAPECKFPGQLDDSLAAWNWVVDNAASLQLDAAIMGIGGDSAGANIAVVLAMQLFADALPDKHLSATPAFQFLLYPLVDFRCQSASYTEHGRGLLLTAPITRFFRDSYLNNSQEALKPSVSPLLATDVSQAPKTLVITAEYDVLRDEGLAFVEKLQQADIAISHLHLQDCTHGFISLAKFSRKTRQRVREVCASLESIKLT